MRFAIWMVATLLALPALAVPPIEHWKTPRGSDVYFVPRSEVPLIDISIDVDAGEARADEPGVAMLAMHALLNKMPERIGEKQPWQTIIESGNLYNTRIDADRAQMTIRLDRSAGLESLLAKEIGDQLARPVYPEELLRYTRRWLAQQMPEKVENAPTSARLQATAMANHPYRLAAMATHDSVDDLSNMQLRRFHKRYYTPANLSISIVGDIPRERAVSIAETLTAYLPDGPAAQPLPAVAPAKIDAPRQMKAISRGPQKAIVLGVPLAPSQSIDDTAALLLGNYMLGGSSFNSRLFKTIRAEDGLSYYARSQLDQMRSGGLLMLTAATKSERREELQKRLNEEFNRFWQQAPSAAEFAEMREQYLLQMSQWGATNSELLTLVADVAFHKRPLDYYSQLEQSMAKLDAAKLHAVWQRYIQPDQLVVIAEE
ncbi:M16 family metallopeptidase [Chitinolyticbacter albus]|uniref:M16 family metallopeptidase n=1 Tax=Chitinolyticbacter albus TaxID=2961951 RepID=UPI00210A2BAA|nr:pitrilysin family protein [Chitinolyticbacter albus]